MFQLYLSNGLVIGYFSSPNLAFDAAEAIFRGAGGNHRPRFEHSKFGSTEFWHSGDLSIKSVAVDRQEVVGLGIEMLQSLRRA